MATIVTVGNNVVNEEKAVKILGKYYEYDVDIALINGLIYSINSNRIYKNMRLNKFILKTENTVNVVHNVINGKPEYSLDEMNDFMIEVLDVGGNEFIKTTSSFFVLDESILDKLNIRYSNMHGCYMTNKYSNYRRITDSDMNYRGSKELYKGIQEKYSSGHLMDKFLKDISEFNTPTDGDILLTKRINLGYSFGIEFETSGGNIPRNKLFKHGLIPLRDGSISGHEYATIPLYGAGGIRTLRNQVALLNKYCEHSIDCSTHLHLGGYPIEKEAIFKLYLLAYKIQNDIKTIFPQQIFNTAKYKSRQKDYCNRLPLFDTFESYYAYLSGVESPFNGDLSKNHPLDERDAAKWNISSRYLWFNLINMCFKESGKTVEFRIHTSTFNIDKIIAWMTICMAILDTAQKLTLEEIKNLNNITLMEIIASSDLDGTAKSTILKYISKRKEYFKTLAEEKDLCGYADLLSDTTQVFDVVRVLDGKEEHKLEKDSH